MWDEPKKKLGIKQSAEAPESDMARVEKRAKKKRKKRNTHTKNNDPGSPRETR